MGGAFTGRSAANPGVAETSTSAAVANKTFFIPAIPQKSKCRGYSYLNLETLDVIRLQQPKEFVRR
jgi:hypothetical protein